MTEFEFWKDDLEKIKGYGFGVSKVYNKPIPCNVLRCTRCKFAESPFEELYGYCKFRQKIIDWLNAEHIEKPVLTKRERAFCEFAMGGYIARSENGNLYCFWDEPHKNCGYWITADGARFAYFAIDTDNMLLPFIKSEDEEPWNVEDLLKLEVQEDE